MDVMHRQQLRSVQSDNIPLPDWPTFGLIDDVRPFLFRAAKAGTRVALATLVEATTGGPRPLGTQMAVTADAVAGSIWGGCVDGDVVANARLVIESGDARLLAYGKDSPYFDIQLHCGGRIEILLEPLQPDEPALVRLAELTGDREPALWLSDGEAPMCLGSGDMPPPQWQNVFDAAEASAAMCGRGDATSYWRAFLPPPRVFVFGRDPVALAVLQLASQAGFETILVRKNGPIDPPAIPVTHYWRGAAIDAFSRYGLDTRTAVLVLGHEVEDADDALAAALRSTASYVGVMGAKRHRAARLRRLEDCGVPEQVAARLKSPIGIPIGSKAPWAVAVSVVADLMSTF